MVLLHWQWFSKPMETTNNFPGWNSRDYCVNQGLTGYRWHSNWDMGRALLINEQLWARGKDTMKGNVKARATFSHKKHPKRQGEGKDEKERKFQRGSQWKVKCLLRTQLQGPGSFGGRGPRNEHSNRWLLLPLTVSWENQAPHSNS